MERTARVIIFALFLKLYPSVDKVDDIGASQQVINKDTWDSSSHKPHLPAIFLLPVTHPPCIQEDNERGQKALGLSVHKRK